MLTPLRFALASVLPFRTIAAHAATESLPWLFGGTSLSDKRDTTTVAYGGATRPRPILTSYVALPAGHNSSTRKVSHSDLLPRFVWLGLMGCFNTKSAR